MGAPSIATLLPSLILPLKVTFSSSNRSDHRRCSPRV